MMLYKEKYMEEEKVFINEYVSTVDDTCTAVAVKANDTVSIIKKLLKDFESCIYKIEKLESKIDDLCIEKDYLFDLVEELNMQVSRCLDTKYKLEDKINKLEKDIDYLNKLFLGIIISIIVI